MTFSRRVVLKVQSLLLASLLGLSSLFSLSALAAKPPAIAAAANVKFALDEIVANFTAETGLALRVSYGSSGNFVAQIQHGAPFEMLLSADEFYVQQLHKAGKTDSDGDIYAIGKLALVAPNNSKLALDPQLTGLSQAVSQGEIKRFVIANPAHAPYGERAQALLESKDLWSALQPKIIMGENVSQAAQFALSGSAQGGIVALSLASAPQFTKMGRYIEIPQSLYQPINQRMVLTPRAGDTTKQFYQYMQSTAAQQVLENYGFGFPANVSDKHHLHQPKLRAPRPRQQVAEQ
ncbi:molybdate ABC transporter substrate-binding protein [Shewanella sp. 1_MG-2023]|uniref:molybdate ABC transporter substrate-binding protein n=1 Tax=unclassified Shewanella TaxID=196818 RepID=UPI000C840B44|nr:MULTISPECIES: molybdate ABC transporter substrate-binding protein [unclassified Shewanella]MDO6612791.1 molybdate ABC transporter substrate-binding protein [Shewanella sp. 7_MG-2023]MDO6772752.1 molybdate ABC transporter substrate-binding protein [Shewanella sp. 2_MG-2023]MDO6794916.1 molybdate ABC transporter substrate-binding protein [Shewanella sp. 1_MG-2023]PMG77618.1 molybdate ABC transporter substrate-binding protein [Shewanella sp. 10N.286.51.B7]